MATDMLRAADFGPLIHSTDVDHAVISYLQTWLPTWLVGTEHRVGKPRSYLPRPTHYTATFDEDDDDHYSDQRLPTVFVTANEAIDWVREGLKYSAFYQTNVSVVTRGRSKVEARLQASLYVATITDILLSRQSLGGFANGIDVVSERIRAVDDPSNRNRHLAAGMGEYVIMVPNVRWATSGPLTPFPPDPSHEPMPIVTEVEIDVIGRELSANLEEE
jgi:hypothetical protein